MMNYFMKSVFFQCECSYYCVVNTHGALEMVQMIMNRKNDVVLMSSYEQ